MQGILKPMVLALVLAALMVAPAFATTVTYTTQASFFGAISGPTTANFDGDTAGTVINNGDTVDGIIFSSVLPGGDQLAIATGFDSTSMSNYLGTTDPGSPNALLGGDTVTMKFGSVTALGLYILTGNPLTDGTFTLDIGGGAFALSSATQDAILGDGTFAYFLGITSSVPFSSATIRPTVLDPNGGPTWNVDDITLATANNGNNPPPQVPEPGTLVLMATGLGAIVRRVRRA